nr:MAG TPA: hypothetical protein [Caudoviricetes sp.]
MIYFLYNILFIHYGGNVVFSKRKEAFLDFFCSF